jgi:hypothetical protein
MPSSYRYKPANNLADLSKEARAVGRRSMAEFLLSPDVLRPVMQATKDIEDAAADLTRAEDLVDTGEFVDSFTSFVGDYMVIDGNPRVTGRVANDSAHAAALEFGNSQVAAHHVLARAGQPFHSEKGPA